MLPAPQAGAARHPVKGSRQQGEHHGRPDSTTQHRPMNGMPRSARRVAAARPYCIYDERYQEASLRPGGVDPSTSPFRRRPDPDSTRSTRSRRSPPTKRGHGSRPFRSSPGCVPQLVRACSSTSTGIPRSTVWPTSLRTSRPPIPLTRHAGCGWCSSSCAEPRRTAMQSSSSLPRSQPQSGINASTPCSPRSRRTCASMLERPHRHGSTLRAASSTARGG